MFPYSFTNFYGLRFTNMYMNSAHIEEKLKKSDCSVEDLLDEDEIIQEMKNQNAKLINFFDKDKIKRLVDYIICEPESDEHKIGHKYPFTASELLNCDVNRITDYFVTTEAELALKDRKVSSVSGADSDMVLSSEDHFNTFSADDKHVGTFEVHRDQVHEVNEVHEEVMDEEKKENKNEITEEKNEEESTKPIETEKENSAEGEQSSEQKSEYKSINEMISSQSHNQIEEKLKTEEELKNKNRIVLLDQLLSFLETDKELNYVLAGYFSKFLSSLINKYPFKVISYIFTERSDIIERLILHSNKKSISDLVPKILLVESYISDKDKDKTNYVGSHSSIGASLNLTQQDMELIYPVRNKMLGILFQSLVLNEEDPEKTNNIVNLCIDLLENRQILEYVTNNKEILDHVFKSLSTHTNSNYNYNELLNLMINIVKFVQLENLRIPTYTTENEEIVNSEENLDKLCENINNTMLGDYFFQNLNDIMKNFLPDETQHVIEGTYGTAYRPLGVKRVKIIEMILYLFTYFKNVQSVFDRFLVASDFLKIALSYFFEYEWNNLYQYNFHNLMKLYLNDVNNHPEITRHLFSDLNILNELMSNAKKDSKFCFNSNRTINHGFYAVLMEICYKLNQAGGGHAVTHAHHSSGNVCFSQINSNNFNEPGSTPHHAASITPTNNFIKSQLTPEWNAFYNDIVINSIHLFERKLCVNEPTSEIIMSDEHDRSEEKTNEQSDQYDEMEQAENKEPEHEDEQNPFKHGKEKAFADDDDWMNPKKYGEGILDHNFLEDINAFEFTDETKGRIHENDMEEIIKRARKLSLKVDEVDEENYTDVNYWNGIGANVISVNVLNDALKDLEL